MIEKKNLVTTKQLTELYPKIFPRKRLLYYLRHRKKNGFDNFVYKISHKCILIDLDLFDKWLNEKKPSKKK